MINLAVLIATYEKDDPVLLDIALRSVLNQSLPECHGIHVYLGVDGPINPRLESVIANFDEQIHCVIKSPSNEGLAATLNKLINCLEDEIFVFRMDADDLSMPLRFWRQIDYLNLHSDVDIVGTSIIEWDATNNSRQIVTFARDHDDAKKKISRRVPVAHPTVCFRRRVFDVVPYYPMVPGNEDIAMWFECLSKGLRFGNVHEPMLQFTINAGFWSRRSFKKSFSELRCYLAGIWALNKCTLDYIYPLARFIMRLSPQWVSKLAYRSKFIRAQGN